MSLVQNFLILALFAISCQAKVVNVKNSKSVALTVRVGDEEHALAARGMLSLTLDDGWSGEISAVPATAEVTDSPRTSATLSLSSTSDTYSISLLNGFNLGLKIVPTGSSNCSSVVCAANLLNACPVANRVSNSLGEVVGCQLSTVIMSTMCPLAVVDDATALTNVKSCSDALSLMVVIV
ncbi:uncharacterized protein LOC126736706 [Anthonomus grandis grandis]|uniref:uncharacterized protein LOC126736706 n=1 Tax=Anthonomus grandis grandis TaxID=2921223 RepID=UPI0021657245|nr:uncharacterized protein LOC126736706 [Anthonomus grandis grandis]